MLNPKGCNTKSIAQMTTPYTMLSLSQWGLCLNGYVLVRNDFITKRGNEGETR